MLGKINKKQGSIGFTSARFKGSRKSTLSAKRPITESAVRLITRKELLEKISFDVMSIIASCESADNANSYDIGHRDGVAEVRVVVDSYFRNLPNELKKYE
jgi:hypothetical protein